MHPDRDFEAPPELLRPRRYRDRELRRQEASPLERDVVQDLALGTLIRAMGGGDEFLEDIARAALLSSLRSDRETILHRQAVLRDCLANPAVITDLYNLTVEMIERKDQHFLSVFARTPGGILYRSIQTLEASTVVLRRLRAIADAHFPEFVSAGFRTFFAMLRSELGDAYLATIEDHLAELRFGDGLLMSAELGEGARGAGFVLHRARERRLSWLDRLRGKRPPGLTFIIADRDEAGHRAVSALVDRGINLAANALAQSADHILSFLLLLRVELGFYVGCLNLRNALAPLCVPIAFPEPLPLGSRRLQASELYDPCLALAMGRGVVGNAIVADGKSLLVITGANQGGKSSFLRALGVAQVMMQAGMFVAAGSFAGELCDGVFTHFKREEDPTMRGGKLDEELTRLSAIADVIGPDSMLFLNESFASTNEREGSEIARQVVTALLEKRVKVLFVTHLYEFARGMAESGGEGNLFLRAERLEDGTRTFKLETGEPRETSFGVDLYNEVFDRGGSGADSPDAAHAGAGPGGLARAPVKGS